MRRESKKVRTGPEAAVKPSNGAPSEPFFRKLVPVLMAAAGGTAILLSFPRFDQYWLAWFGGAFMFLAFRGRGFRQAFGLGMIAGFIGNMGGFYWISNMLQEFAHMSAWLSWVITCLLIAYQGIYYALAAGVSAAVTRRWPRVPWLLAFPVAYTAFEFVHPLIFPWYAANGQQLFYPVIQIADLVGAPGISFLLILVGTAIGQAVVAVAGRRPFPVVGTVVAVVALAASLIYGAVRIDQVDRRAASAPKFRVGLIEADVGIWEKEGRTPEGKPLPSGEKNARLLTNLLAHQYLSSLVEKEYRPDLIVWPETSYLPMKHVYVKRPAGTVHYEADDAGPEPVGGIPAGIAEGGFVRAWPIPTDAEKIWVSGAPLSPAGQYRAPFPGVKADQGLPLAERNAAMRGFSTPLILGTGSIEPGKGPKQVIFNTALLMDGDGDILGMYRKTKLLVFGEYLPFEKQFPFLRSWLPEAGVWTAGDGPRVFELGQARIGVSICYEDLLAPFTRDMMRLGPNLMVNITNDAWFGKTREPWLHLQLAELRSVETRMAMARATNTGISAIVDPVGRRVSHTSMEEPEYLVADVPLMSENTVYMRFGDFFAWACCLLVLAMAVACVVPVRKTKTSE